jgi:hypothetical protein
MGVQPHSFLLSVESLDEGLQRAALSIRTTYKDEGVRAVLDVLELQKTRCLYALASFAGDPVRLAKIQGQMEAVMALAAYIHDAGNMAKDEAQKLHADKQAKAKARVLEFGNKNRSDVVI